MDRRHGFAGTGPYFFFLFGRCVSAEPAAVFESLPVLPLFKTFEAAVAARLLVFSLLPDGPFTEGGGRLGNFC